MVIMSAFSNVKLIEFKDDAKIRETIENGGVGVYLAGEEYRDHDGKQWTLPSVKLAEQEVRQEQPIIADYIFPNMFLFPKLAAKLALGEDSPAVKENRVFSTQAMSGTAALRLGAEFLVSVLGITTYYHSNPTWDNLFVVFEKAGFKEAHPYRYWCPSKHDIDFPGLMEDLGNATQGAVVVLHASCHNPTGIDLSKDQWKQVASIMKERKLIPFFDSVFQGLAKDLEEDAWPIRHFVEQGFELFCAQSFSKICGLYNERIGSIFIVAKDSDMKSLVEGNINPLMRGLYLTVSAPANRIVTKLWTKPELKIQWVKDIETMRNRIKEARKDLRATLERLGTPGDWSFITRQTGITTLIGLNAAQVEHLSEIHQVFLSANGRTNFSAITKKNVEYVAKAIHETIKSVPN